MGHSMGPEKKKAMVRGTKIGLNKNNQRAKAKRTKGPEQRGTKLV